MLNIVVSRRLQHFSVTAVCICLAFGIARNCQAESAVLRAEWKLDEGEGDSAGNALANTDAATVAAQWAKGSFGTALYLSESPGATASVPDSELIQFGKQSFSISLWVCPTRLAVKPKGQYRRLLCKSSYPGTFWTLDVFDSGKLMLAMKDDLNINGTTQSKGMIKEKNWSHLAIVVDRKEFQTRYFINGHEDCAQPFNKKFSGNLNVPGKPLQVSTWRKFIGLVDNLRIYRGALSSESILGQYKAERETYADTEFKAARRKVENFSVPIPAGDRQLMWDLSRLSAKPRTFSADLEAKEKGVNGIYYESVLYKGKPTRVFAWYGAPAEQDEKLPGMVLVHGGGGTAFSSWVKTWNDRGYAAIAMDTSGCIPVKGKTRGWTRTEHGGPGGWGGFDQISEAVHDQWTYHAVSAVVLGHSLLRSMPEVDAERIGLTGISWGGYLTCIVSGVDSRFRFTAPVYGCGFLGENSAWLNRFHAMGRANALTWLKRWDPSQYLGFAANPMLYVNGTNDHF